MAANWHSTGNMLSRSWAFANFSEAWAFASRVALVAEKSGHHPQIMVEWGKVTVSTTTHDAGNTITDKDQKLAEALNALTPNTGH